jgi:hypothetical protein
VTARRPDGSGGSLARDERIDDIQFYIDPAGELLIDDLILYEAAPGGEPRIMPSRPIFTGWLDTGKQGVEWPGEFQIVLHEKPWKWDAAKSVSLGKGGAQHLRVNMRGKRIMSPKTELSFRYKLTGRDGPLRISVSKEAGIPLRSKELKAPRFGAWAEANIQFEFAMPTTAANLEFTPASGAVLLVDDLLLFEK